MMSKIDEGKLRGLFINPVKANCSISESGYMIYQCLLQSDKYNLDYLEIDEENRKIPATYDFYAFNYHHARMAWLDTRDIRRLPGLKITFVLEALPNDPFVLCPKEDFDAYCVLDPTMHVLDNRVYTFPRPLEIARNSIVYQEQKIPIIGSFGFATPGKGFELVVDAVNREFDTAIIKINIPPGAFADPGTWELHKRNYAEYLEELCVKVAKKGIEVIITHDYMTKDQLIDWCSKNTLNCFLYNRMQPGLSATTDQAISSGRPLAISTNETFRHIHQYIKPYPFRSLKESIQYSQPEVLRLQDEWSPKKFVYKFEKVLADLNKYSINSNISNHIGSDTITLKKKFTFYIPHYIRPSVHSILHLSKKHLKMNFQRETTFFEKPIQKNTHKHHLTKVIIISHKEKQCGIYQYGINIAEALKKSDHFNFIYAECSNKNELDYIISYHNPAVIIYNYYPITMPWLTKEITRQYPLPQLGIMHEVTQKDADNADQEMFDYHLCPDPTLKINNSIIFKTKRLIPPYINSKKLPDIVSIGSFGFGFDDKGFEHIVTSVQDEFDEAIINFLIPFNDIMDKYSKKCALLTAKKCKKLIKKPGIKLNISHKFLTKKQVLDFLANNTINAFFYESEKNRGISSTIDYALAVQRPIAITKCGMFRHILSAKPSINIEDSSLKDIISNDIVPLVRFYNEWSEAAFIMDYERLINQVINYDL